MIKKGSGFQRKYLRYTIGLLLLALLLSSVGVWFYMRKNMIRIVTDQYAFLNEKTGIALDNLYQESDKVMEECILDDTVQQSLKAKPLAEVDKNSLRKYFAYVNLNYVSEYCYADNKQNLYTRSYSKIPYSDFKESGLVDKLGDSYADTQWFVTEDTLFGTGKKALYIGRKVHSLNYAHKPGYLFLEMNDGFLNSLKEDNDSFNREVAIGVMDQDGNICASWYPASFSMGEYTAELLKQYSKEEKSGVVVRSKKVPNGMLSLYKQEQTGFCVFTIVPDQVLNQGTVQIVYVIAGIYLLVIFIAVLLSIYFSGKITRPIKVINQAMTEFDGNDFSNEVHLNSNTELDQIGNTYNKMLINIKNLLDEVKDQQKELRVSELNMLINQINPHFLYNTLDTIYMLARINKEETTMKMIQALSKYLRLSLSKGSDIVTVEDELENVKSYLQIQQIRNENLFTYTVDCEVDAEHTWMLKLILQPLVENSIKYGFCEIYEGGVIRIHIYKEDGNLVLTVFNNGKPMEEEMAQKINGLNEKPISEAKKSFPNQKNGYGVVNVLTRLRLKYGDDVRYLYQAESDGTLCRIQIPGDGEKHEEE